MDKLSQEIIDHIISYFYPLIEIEDLKQMLTVSKAFQNSVERVMLAQYNLKEDNADSFLCLYTGKRMHYLRHVEFRPILPMASGDRNWDEGCREKTSELVEKDESFTRQIGFLFRTLKCLEDGIGSGKMTGKLRLTIFSPRRFAEGFPCRHRVSVCWRVHLLDPETLPRLSSIHTLEIKDQGTFVPTFDRHTDPNYPEYHPQSKLDLRILVDLASKIISLEQLQCNLSTYFSEAHSAEEETRHFLQDWAGPHRDTRHDFAASLDSTVTPPSLKRINLNFHRRNDEYRDQREILPNLVLPRHYDPFSTSLRVFSYHLETMILRVAADRTLFWPTTDGTTTPYWPNLKYLDVCFCSYSPSGEWYFQGPRGEGGDTSPGYQITQSHYEPMEANATERYYDEICQGGLNCNNTETQFRIMPIGKTIRPLLIAFAKGASNMPSLRKAVLRTWLEFRPSDAYNYYEDLETEIIDATQHDGTTAWGIAYAKAGEDIDMKGMGHKNCASRQFWWITGDWRPDATLYSLFDKIGQFQHGNEAIHHWASAQGHKWVRRFTLNGFIG